MLSDKQFRDPLAEHVNSTFVGTGATTMKIKTDYSYCRYITPSKVYAVDCDGLTGQQITDDEGDTLEVFAPPFEGPCGHLGGEGYWSVVEDDKVEEETMNEKEMSQDPFFMFRLELRAGKELGQNCYDENDLLIIRELMELLTHAAETDEPEVADLYKALKWFLIPSDYKRFTELVRKHLPQDALENVLPNDVDEKLDFGMDDFFKLLEEAGMDALITPAGITLWEEERQMVNAVSLMTAINILEKKIEYENVFVKHC